MLDIAGLGSKIGETIELSGWAYNFRSSGSIFFLQLRDGTARVQVVFNKADVSEESWTVLEQLGMEASVTVTGVVKSEPRAPSGIELHGISCVLIAAPAAEFPISKKEHGTDFLMDNRHLWLRSSRQEAILRVRNEIAFALREFFYHKNFVLTDSPIFTPNACESTSELFEVKYFDDVAYLTQSGQLYLEATSSALKRTYCFGPTFRSEKSKTRRHLTEFWMLEAEASFMDQIENMALQEEMVVFVVKRVLERRADDLKTLERDTAPLQKVAEGNFPRIRYTDAIKQLQDLGSDIKDGDDLGADDETVLTKQYDRPIFITHYPVAVKSFYMKPDPADPRFVLNADMLAPEGYGEVIGGSQRIDDLALLEERIKQHGLPREAFEWYLDIRRFGSVPHAGFGIGLERTVAWVCGLEHIRETIPFPRLLNRLNP
ncbi:MAG: asparagine--tRNA ligase [Candidatus Magasanikbacteria bacterium RIFCSPHIGHO2_01_FULL_50_8]|uniref:Asparagine--tRNA ligase n=2 Tax=Candidatus Magasanikiibacteriota TaxID=1752731 RepID=A0A1F6LNH7_9BACT|nr:MAG: asparagine--tRNA ligase [Candidatus Magasanikbacteria bacterium RIFCSPHIGHO2_01_FULL_50_8]OGH67423.1 MAG: asparagine--tRNA ligase [Candidatus Magasanikbacteria bacterium RIFCSPHIGHO2_02_FULL_50_9b]